MAKKPFFVNEKGRHAFPCAAAFSDGDRLNAPKVLAHHIIAIRAVAHLALDNQAGVAVKLPPRLPPESLSFGAVALAGLEFGLGVKASDGLIALLRPGVVQAVGRCSCLILGDAMLF